MVIADEEEESRAERSDLLRMTQEEDALAGLAWSAGRRTSGIMCLSLMSVVTTETRNVGSSEWSLRLRLAVALGVRESQGGRGKAASVGKSNDRRADKPGTDLPVFKIWTRRIGPSTSDIGDQARLQAREPRILCRG